MGVVDSSVMQEIEIRKRSGWLASHITLLAKQGLSPVAIGVLIEPIRTKRKTAFTRHLLPQRFYGHVTCLFGPRDLGLDALVFDEFEP
jgi:hypothetical protein